jgi:uncharacterized membrane protein
VRVTFTAVPKSFGFSEEIRRYRALDFKDLLCRVFHRYFYSAEICSDSSSQYESLTSLVNSYQFVVARIAAL